MSYINGKKCITLIHDNEIKGVTYTDTSGTINLDMDETPSNLVVVNSNTSALTDLVIYGDNTQTTNVSIAGGNIQLLYRYGNVIADGLEDGNIAKGKVILGHTGTYEGGDTTQEDALITREITSYTNDRVTKVGNSAFRSCSSLTSIDIPQATSIGNYAFSSCSNLTSISLPQATIIDSYAFSSCSNLTSISLPQATSIMDYAFSSCSNLTSISLPLATIIDSYAFSGCSNLTSISLPQATSIGRYAFQVCSNLTSISLPNVKTINNGVFNACKNLTIVNLPQVTSIMDYAFTNCYSLIKLIITQTTSICTLNSTNAFNKCYHFLGTTDSTYNPTGAKDGRIYVPDELVDSYKEATNWSAYADIIVGLSELEE